MQELEYSAPGSIAEAVALLGEGAHVLAGGTDLLVRMRSVPPQADRLVDVKKIPELGRITLDDSGLALGAAVSCWEMSKHAGLAERFPGLLEAAKLIGSMQIQGRASLGGNLCNASPAADTVPALIALSAECVIAGPSGERTVAAQDFATGPGTTVLAPDELLVELRIATPPPGTADAYLRFIPRGEMDIAVVGAGASVTLDSQGVCTAARVSLGAVAPTALLVEEAAAALVGGTLDDDALQRAGAAAAARANPIDDKRGTAEYRRHVAGVLTRRVVQRAADRARQRRS